MDQYSYLASTRKVWRSLKVAFLTTRKGLASKRRLVVEAYAKAWRKYTHLIIVLHKHEASGARSTARPLPAAGHSFRPWECDDRYFSAVLCNFPADSKRSYGIINDDGRIDEELDHEVVSGPSFGSPGCGAGHVDVSGAAADEDEGIDDRAEEFIRKFYEELRAQSHNYDDLSLFL